MSLAAVLHLYSVRSSVLNHDAASDTTVQTEVTTNQISANKSPNESHKNRNVWTLTCSEQRRAAVCDSNEFFCKL